MKPSANDQQAADTAILELAVLDRLLISSHGQHRGSKYFRLCVQVKQACRSVAPSKLTELLERALRLLSNVPDSRSSTRAPWIRAASSVLLQSRAAVRSCRAGLEAIIRASKLLAHQVHRAFFITLCVVLLACLARLLTCIAHLGARLFEVHGILLRAVLAQPGASEYLPPQTLSECGISEETKSFMSRIREASLRHEEGMDEKGESKSVGKKSRDGGDVTASGTGNDSARALDEGGNQGGQMGTIEKGSMPEDDEEEDLGTFVGTLEREQGEEQGGGVEDPRGGESVEIAAADTTSIRSEANVRHSEGGDDRRRGDKTDDDRVHTSPKVRAAGGSSKVTAPNEFSGSADGDPEQGGMRASGDASPVAPAELQPKEAATLRGPGSPLPRSSLKNAKRPQGSILGERPLGTEVPMGGGNSESSRGGKLPSSKKSLLKRTVELGSASSAHTDSSRKETDASSPIAVTTTDTCHPVEGAATSTPQKNASGKVMGEKLEKERKIKRKRKRKDREEQQSSVEKEPSVPACDAATVRAGEVEELVGQTSTSAGGERTKKRAKVKDNKPGSCSVELRKVSSSSLDGGIAETEFAMPIHPASSTSEVQEGAAEELRKDAEQGAGDVPRPTAKSTKPKGDAQETPPHEPGMESLKKQGVSNVKKKKKRTKRNVSVKSDAIDDIFGSLC